MTVKRFTVYKTFVDRGIYDDDLINLAVRVLDRMASNVEDGDDDGLWHAMDDGLIYYADQWTMLKAYCTPQNADFNAAWDSFTEDLNACIVAGALD